VYYTDKNTKKFEVIMTFTSFTIPNKMEGFDFNEFTQEEKAAAYTFLARTAEQAERYDDMAHWMKKLVQIKYKIGTDLAGEDRNLLSVAYKNVIGAKRASWRTFSEPLTKDEEKYQSLVNSFQAKLEVELDTICDEILALLNDLLIPLAKDEGGTEAQVFYLKMCGDYYRYKAEYSRDKKRDAAAKRSADLYDRAMKIAGQGLPPTHPIRLGLALNFSVCYFEILDNPTKACDLAKTAFDDAIQKLNELQEDSYKDSTLIMQLLRDNLTLWTQNQPGTEGDVVLDDRSDDDIN
jgi:hypothetical protein